MPPLDEIEKIPPQSLEVEMSLLGSILIDKEAITKIADVISTQDFYKDAHARIFEAMEELYSHSEPIDLLTISNRLEEKGLLETIGGRSYLAALANSVPTASNVVNYAHITHRKAVRRRLLSASHEIARLGYEENEDLDRVLDEAQRHLFGVSQIYFKQGFSPIRGVLAEAFDRIDELHRNKGQLRGLPTGFAALDNLLAGMQKSDLIVLAARPSVGKTSLALDIVRQVGVRQKLPTALFSLEMSKEQLVDRLLCAEANVDLWRMRTGRLSERPEDDDFPRIGHAIGTLSEAPIFIDDSPNINIMQIRTKARRLQAEHGLGLIVIDYLQLMESRTSVENRVQEVAEITRGLKGIARELNVPVLALSQLSRVVEQSKPAIPKLSHLRESGCLAGDTLLMRADTGKLTAIKDLVGQKNIPILTLTKEYKLVVKNISKIFSSGRKRLYKLKTRSGRTIRASGNHPFLTIAGWRRLDGLSPGEHVAAPRSLAERQHANSMSDNELILLAHLTGDGCVLPRQPIHYTSADKQCLNVVAAAARTLFAISPRLVKQKNWHHLYLPSPYRLARGKRHPITRWFEKLGIKPVRSYEKILPAVIFTCDKQKIALFLRHLWATDGNISFKKMPGRKTVGAVYYATSSHKLAMQVQHLLLRLEILAAVRTVKQKKYRSMYHVWVQAAAEQLKFCDLIGAFGKRGAIVEKLKTHLRSQPLSDLASSDIYWDKIVSITPLGAEEVFDATVPETHNFIANDFIVHNSIEQDADVVLFIYRKSADRNYRQEDIPPDERYLAEVHIAKHRNGPTGLVKLIFSEQTTSFHNLERRFTATEPASASAAHPPLKPKSAFAPKAPPPPAAEMPNF